MVAFSPMALHARDDDPHEAYRDLFPAGFAFPENRDPLVPADLAGQTMAIIPGRKFLESVERFQELTDPEQQNDTLNAIFTPGSGDPTQALQMVRTVGSPQRLLDETFNFLLPHSAGVVVVPDLATATDRGASTFIVLDYAWRIREFPPPVKAIGNVEAYVFDALLNKRTEVRSESRVNFASRSMFGGQQTLWFAYARTLDNLSTQLMPLFLGQLAGGFGWPAPPAPAPQ